MPRGSQRVAAYAEAFSQLEDPTGFGAKCARHAAPPSSHPLPALHARSQLPRTPYTPLTLPRTHPWQVGTAHHRAAPQRVLQLQQPRTVQLEWWRVALRDVQGGHSPRQPAAALPRAGVCSACRMCMPHVHAAMCMPQCACRSVHAAVCMPQCACICMHSTTLRSARRRALPSSAFSSRTRAHTRAPMRRASRPRTSMRTCTPVRNCTPPAPRLHPPAPRWVPPLPIPLHPTPSLPPFPTSRNAHACRRRLLDHPAQAARHRAVAGHRRAGRGARPAARARHPLLPLDV